jgi:hypothetical protein
MSRDGDATLATSFIGQEWTSDSISLQMGGRMFWRRHFTDEMNEKYKRLAVDQAKRDVLWESVRDVAFGHQLYRWFLQNGGGSAMATLFTLRATMELVAGEWVTYGRWNAQGEIEGVSFGDDELFEAINTFENSEQAIYFLLPTQKGKDWLTRHHNLLSELDHCG